MAFYQTGARRKVVPLLLMTVLLIVLVPAQNYGPVYGAPATEPALERSEGPAEHLPAQLTAGDPGSTVSAISADGRFVAFESGATNLVLRDTSEVMDVAADPMPQPCVGDGVYLYEHPNYQGRCLKFTASHANLVYVWFNDVASSIRFVGSYGGFQYVAKLYEHSDYRTGVTAGTVFQADDPDFDDDTIGHDRASSIKIVAVVPSPCQGDGVYLYEHANYQGRCRKFTTDAPDLAWRAFNDIASSIRFVGSYAGFQYVAKLYEQDDYKSGEGAGTVFQADDPDFGDDAIGLDRASSIRIVAVVPSPCEGDGVYLYEHPDYQGRCRKFTADAPDLAWRAFNDIASSIRFVGSYAGFHYVAKLYDRTDYKSGGGVGTVFAQDDPNFSDDAVGHDRASSIKIVEVVPSPCEGDGVYLYEHSSYQGRCRKFTVDAPDLAWRAFDNIASSIKFAGSYGGGRYVAKLYDQDDYEGSPTAFQADDADFGDDDIGHDRASSIRVAESAVGEPDIRIEPNSLTFDSTGAYARAAARAAVELEPVVEPTIVRSDAQALILDLPVPRPEVVDVEADGEIFQRLQLPGAGPTLEVGRPELPVLGYWIGIPDGAEATVQVLDATFNLNGGYHIWPHQEPLPDQAMADADFEIDRVFYQRDAFYPQPLVMLERPVNGRAITAAVLRLYPVQHNPKSGELKVYSHLRVQVNFLQDRMAIQQELPQRSPHFDAVYRDLVLNYDDVQPPPSDAYGPQRADEGAEFLIITAPQFVAAANALAAWRNAQGLLTQVRTTNHTGSTASAIQSYIRTAYSSWSPAPSFVLFLGDAEHIPTHYVTPHPSYNHLIGTDLYYATLEGSDYFPEIALGRISVDTVEQAQKAVNDIIDYERNPVTDESFYSRAAVAAHFQDDKGDDFEDRRFVLTSEEIRDYLRAQGYQVQRIYHAYANRDPRYYNNGRHAQGESLPDELLRSNGFKWDGDAADIAQAVNNGVFVMNHRDHGGFARWVHPSFYVSDVNALRNGNKLPMVFSINCMSGWFDNETNVGIQRGFSDVSFAESWQRNPNGGAVGVFASTRVSYTPYNDVLVKGFYDAIWPSFLPYGLPSSTARRAGDVLNYGKMYLASAYGEGIIRQAQFEMYHYFGDPTTQLWTSPASAVQKSFTIHNDGKADLEVTGISVQGGRY